MRRPSPHRLAHSLLVAALLSTSAASRAAPPPPRTPLVKPGGGDAGLLAAADDITRQVVALRGLPQLRPVAKGVLTREAIGAKLRERIAKEYTPDEIRIESRVLKRLGLLPQDVDYEKLLVELLMEQVAGFYDPFARQLYIADWLGMELQRPAIAHEIQHALQDQHFDLKKFATPIKDDGDRQLARSAVVEGDGTVVMIDFLAQSMGLDTEKLPGALEAMGEQVASGAMAASPVFDRAPRFLRETLLFPYVAGMKFVLALRRGGQPWSKVNEAFKNPPESTEQVIHPAKYAAHEHPIVITAAPITALAPAKELRRDVLGELEWRVLLASKLADGQAERAAEGWGGDRLVAYALAEGPVAVIDLSTWDSEDDAIQIDSALRKLLPRQTAQAEKSPDLPPVYTVGGEAWSVERRGRDVLVMFGVPKDARAAATDEIWKKWKIGRVPSAP
ncbi:MAG: hypothetical protein EXR72_13170 [Myxococcales bacterium]|nr:hypothetical protein [Myxococcales bacterium]